MQQMCRNYHICYEKCSYSLAKAETAASAQQLVIQVLTQLLLNLCLCVHLCHQWYSNGSMSSGLLFVILSDWFLNVLPLTEDWLLQV